MKKIYITGIAGLLGSNLAFYLKNYYDIVGADLVEFNSNDIDVEVIDLLNKDILEQSIVANKVDILIHTAAAIDVDSCEKNPKFAVALNTELTKVLSEICYKYRIKMIYISTDAVFDGNSSKLYNEGDKTNPLNVYARTKLEGENYVLKDSSNVIVRTNIYGYNMQDKKSFGEWILYSLLNGDTLNMFEDIIFSPILVNELSNIIYQIIKKDLCGLYHVCGSGSLTKYEFGLAIKEIFNIKQGSINKVSSDTYHFDAKRSKNMGMSNEKIKNELNIEIRTPLESIEYFKKLYDEGFPEIIKEMRK